MFQTLLFQRESGRIIYSQAQKASEGTLTNLQDDLYALYKQAENSLINLYAGKQFILDLADGNIEAYRSKAYDLAFSAFDASQNLAALYIYTVDHGLISAYRHAQTPKYTYPEDIYDGSMPNNQQAVLDYVASDEDALLVSGYYNPKREANLVRHVLKLRTAGGQLCGYAVCDLGPKAYEALLTKYLYSEGQIIWLQRPGVETVLSTRTGSDAYAAVSASILSGQDLPAQSGYELFHADQRKYRMNAYLLMPQSELMENQSALNRVTLLACALIVSLFTLLFLLLSRSLTGPLRSMVSTMNRIQSGESGLRMEGVRRDEFGQLGLSFNRMLDQIELQNQREVKSRLLVNEAKYKALQAQINPHFLYNTLDTMGGIASVSNADMVAVMCRALSNIFRYSLDMSDSFATLADELKHLKNYMLIVDVRTQGSIELFIDVPQELMRERLPRVTLQPLVENAVRHGLTNKRGEKRVSVKAERRADQLVITVSDSGTGMDVQKINQMLKSDDADALAKADSIGLSNIHARLRLLFGADSGLSVSPAPEGGSVVTLVLKGARKDAE